MLIGIAVGVSSCAALAVCAIFAERGAFFYISVCAILLSTVIFCLIDGEKYTHAYRTALVAFVSTVSIVIAYIVYTQTGLSEKFTDFDALKQFILDSGFWGVAIFMGLTLFQVIVLPIPAALTIVLGVAIYGPTVSFILSTIGTIVGSLITFMLGKVFGRRLCNWMFGEETTSKYASLINERGRWLFALMELLPAFPDDMLCMVAGITDMSYGFFTIVCCLTRPVMIAVTAYLGSGIIPFSGWGVPVWVGIVALTVFVLIAVMRFKSSMMRSPSLKDKKHRAKRV